MGSWGKLLLIILPVALLLTGAFRFIQHTDHEYASWIEVFGASAALLAKRCAEQKTANACTAAEKRAALVAELNDYRDSVTAWWLPILVAMLLAWVAVLASCFSIARVYIRRRRK